MRTASGLVATIFRIWPPTDVSGRAYRSFATIWMPAACAAFENSFHQPSP